MKSCWTGIKTRYAIKQDVHAYAGNLIKIWCKITDGRGR